MNITFFYIHGGDSRIEFLLLGFFWQRMRIYNQRKLYVYRYFGYRITHRNQNHCSNSISKALCI